MCRSDFFGEVAILKEQPRSTSAIAANRCVLLSLDRLEFLHLISYGNSNVTGSSIDEEDKRFNEIISKYIGMLQLHIIINACCMYVCVFSFVCCSIHEFCFGIVYLF